MDYKKIIKDVKKAWDWVWHSDSLLSWVVALVIIFVFVRFIFLPGLGFIMGTSLPLAGVESSSMDHSSTKFCLSTSQNGLCTEWSNNYELCGNFYDKKINPNFNEYWEICGNWYEERNVSKNEFSDFTLKNGFKKGDIIIVWGRFTPKVGDIIIFNAIGNAPRPIIHRIVNIDENGIIQTKGDHNNGQLEGNNVYGTDETHITKDKIIGKAVFKIPYLGWVKIWGVDLVKRIF
jgi:hypothetical protein